MVKNIVIIVQILISIFLIIAILMQNRGSGLSSSFGGGGEFYRSRRGIENILLKASIVLAILFLVSSILNLLVR